MKVPWSIGDALTVFVVSWILLPAALILSLSVFGSSWPPVQHFVQGLGQGDLTANFIFVLADGLAALAIVRYFALRAGANWRDLGLQPFKVAQAVAYILLAVLAFGALLAAAFALVAWLYPHFNPNQDQVNQFTRQAGGQGISFWALVILPPLIEEVVFRGFIFPAVASKYGFWLGAAASSLLFGLAHWQLNISVYTFVLGCLLCMMYWRLRSIVPGMAFHMLNNYLAYLALAHR
jgi:hypothetical protein